MARNIVIHAILEKSTMVLVSGQFVPDTFVELSNGISARTWADDSQADESRIQDLVDSVIYPSNNWVPLPPSSLCIPFCGIQDNLKYLTSTDPLPPPPPQLRRDENLSCTKEHY